MMVGMIKGIVIHQLLYLLMQLIYFFNRFDTEVSSLNCNSICQTIPYCSLVNLMELDGVASIFKIKPGKARGLMVLVVKC